MSNDRTYAYVIERADDGAYWAYLPDLPGCATSGDTAEQVVEQRPEAVALYLSDYQQRGLPVPASEAQVGTLTLAS